MSKLCPTTSSFRLIKGTLASCKGCLSVRLRCIHKPLSGALEGPVAKLKICGVLILTAFVMGAAYAAPGRGGGGGGGGHFGGGGGAHFGGGGGAHFGGGGGAHFGGGGGAHFGGGARIGGAPHFGGGARFGGAPRFRGRSSISRFAG